MCLDNAIVWDAISNSLTKNVNVIPVVVWSQKIQMLQMIQLPKPTS